MTSAPQPQKRRRIIGTLIFAAIALFGLTLIVLGTRPATLQDRLSWLTPVELTRTKHISPLTRLKFRVMNWTAPLWKTYWRNRPQINIKASVLKLSTATSWPSDIALPFATATNGTRAWILSPMQIKNLQSQIATLPEIAVTAAPHIITADECAAQISVGNSFATGSNVISTGLGLYVMPNTARDKIALTFGFEDTEVETNAIGGVCVKTNQAYACQAVFPNNGGLLLENPTPQSGQSNRSWLLLTARATDVNGHLLGQ